MGGGADRRRECHMFEMTPSQVDKDLCREKFRVDGEEVVGLVVKEQVKTLLCKWGRVAARGGDEGLAVNEALQRILQSSSRTVFGGDSYFIVNDLFGGEGVVVMPTHDSTSKHEPITVSFLPADESGQAGGTIPLLCRVIVRSTSTFSLYHNTSIHQATERATATPMVSLLAHVVETFPIEVLQLPSSPPTTHLCVGSGTTRIVHVEAEEPKG